MSEQTRPDDDWLMRIGAIEEEQEEREYEHTIRRNESDTRFELPSNIADDNIPI